VRPNVGSHGGWKKAGTGIAVVEALAEIGGGDVFVDGGEEMDASALAWSEGERGEPGLIQEGG
jgi:hypothetical protein